MRPKNLIALNGPADTCPSYLRARLLYIERAIRDYEDKQGMGYKTLRYGVIPDEDSKLGDICSIQTFEHLKDYPPLDFMELTRFNTWFTLHPEKVCGKEFVTTSLLFPVSIKGKEEDIVQTIHRFIDPGEQWEKQREQEAELSKLRSKAFRLRIKLLKNRYWQNQTKGI